MGTAKSSSTYSSLHTAQTEQEEELQPGFVCEGSPRSDRRSRTLMWNVSVTRPTTWAGGQERSKWTEQQQHQQHGTSTAQACAQGTTEKTCSHTGRLIPSGTSFFAAREGAGWYLLRKRGWSRVGPRTFFCPPHARPRPRATRTLWGINCRADNLAVSASMGSLEAGTVAGVGFDNSPTRPCRAEPCPWPNPPRPRSLVG